MQYPWMGPAPQPQYQQQGSHIEGVRWVSSIDEVNGTTIGFGQSALFMFSGEDAFAVKSVSPSGVPSVKVFDFKERPPAVPAAAIDPDRYVTKEEFEKLRSMYEQLVQPDRGTAAADADAGQHITADAAGQHDAPAGPAAVLQPGGANGMDF